jgi:hypothetical protein
MMGRGRYRTQRLDRQKKHQKDPPPEEPKARITIDDGKGFKLMLTPRIFTVDIERDYVDVTTFGNTNQEYLVGSKTYTIKATE